MSFRPFAEAPIADLIETAGAAPKLTLLVGAGASMEAGLDSWERLLDKLLVRAARERGLIDADDRQQRDRWVAESHRDGYLGAAAIVDALADGARDAWLGEELFAGRGPAAYYPGPISRQIARLAELFGSALRILTTNYDDLIEQAIKDAGAGEPRAIATGADLLVPPGSVGVYHLHGYLGRDGRPSGDLVLSEGDYQRMHARGGWQESFARTALLDSCSVFVGTSLLDPNMIRYLHGVAEGPPRFAVFVRQGTYPQDVPAGIPEAREAALRRRWQAVGVTPVFVDHYVDVAQVLYEIGLRRDRGKGYVALPERAAEWAATIERAIVGWHDRDAFERAQRTLNRLLSAALADAVETARRLGGERWDEVLQMALWLVDATGESMTSWVTTDRIHVDRRTVEPVPIDEHSRWVAVRSYCRGAPLAESRDVYASRWRFVRGTPLLLETARHGRLPIGCLTTASLAGRETSGLARMPGDVERAFNAVLSNAVRTLLDQPFIAAP